MSDLPAPLRKKRMNPVLFFPPVVLADINAAIDEGWRAPHIRNVLLQKWSNQVKRVPCIVTIDKYLHWYIDQKKEEKQNEISDIQDSAKEIQKGLERVLDPKITIMDKRVILEVLVRKCGERIKTLERWQRTTISPAFESCLVRYIAEVRALIETLAKLNNELQPDQQIILNVIDTKIPPIFTAFYNVIAEIAPDKIDFAKLRLREELKRVLPGGQ